MKKIVLFLALIMSVVALSACQDQKYNDERISVVFFTANTGATLIDTYFNLEPNQLISEPSQDPTRPGFVFDGWYVDYQQTELWDFDVDRVGETSMVLFAKWNPAVFNIIYDLNGGVIPATDYPTEFYSGDSNVLPQPSQTGFLFVSWYLYDWIDESSTKPGDAGYQSLPPDYFQDLYLYAHWEAITVRITFRANYPIDGEGPENPDSKTVGYGSIIDFEELADTTQYRFVGWNSKQDGTGTFYVDGDIFERTQRITLNGVWELIE